MAMTFETAAAHATLNVPIASPSRSAREVRAMLQGRTYESASHVVVCEGDRFIGIATIEAVLSAPDETTVASLMDRDAPVVAPGSIRKSPHGAPSGTENLRLPLSIRRDDWPASFLRIGSLQCCLPSTKRISRGWPDS